jgi:dicarboxylate transporter DctA-like protein
MRKRLSLTLLFLLLLIAAFATWLYFNRLGVVEKIIRDTLADQSYEEISLDVHDVWFDRLEIANLRARAKDDTLLQVDAAKINFTYRWGQPLIIDKIAIRGAKLTIIENENGFALAGFPQQQKNANAKPPTLPTEISLDKIRLTIQTKTGEIVGSVAGSYALIDDKGEGRLRGKLSAPLFSMGEVSAQNSEIDFDLILEPSGAFTFNSNLSALFTAGENKQKPATGGLFITGTGWPDAMQDGIDSLEADILAFATLPALPVTSLGNGALFPQILAPQEAQYFDLSLRTDLRWQDGQVSTAQSERAVNGSLVFDNTVQVDFSSPRIPSLDSSEKIALEFSVTAPLAKQLQGKILLGLGGGGDQQISGEVQAASWSNYGATLSPFSSKFDLGFSDESMSGTIETKSLLTRYVSDNSLIENINLNWHFNIEAKPGENQIRLFAQNTCTNLGNPRLKLGEINYSMKKAQFCRKSHTKPAIILDSTDDTTVLLSGKISGQSARFTSGATKIYGAPPVIDLELDIKPHEAKAVARFSGGAFQINDLVRVSDLKARSDITIREGRLGMTTKINRAKADDLSTPTFYNTLVFRGNSLLASNQLDFDGIVATTGQGGSSHQSFDFADITGRYDLEKGEGHASLHFDDLRFDPKGLQPSDLTPAVKGFLENATGAASGQVEITIEGDEVTSSARISLDNLTFNGPTRAITQTAGVRGEAVFDSLFPLRSSGLQQIRVDLIDLDALKLENGLIEFEVTGDDTLYLRNAEWQWFGGVLRIRDGVIPLGMESSNVSMVVENLDLSLLADYINMDGLSAEGRIDGLLPLVFEGGAAKVENGILATIAGGVFRYQGKALDSARASLGTSGELAVDALREFQFDRLTMTLNGDLDGEIEIGLRMEGKNPDLYGGVPIKYNINIEAPISGLIQQFRAGTKPGQQVLDELNRKIGVEMAIEEISREGQE